MLFAALIIFQISIAQTAIAKLKFEDAEEAFNNKDYTTALVKLDEAEKILGKTNPPMLYLRILSQDNMITIDPLKDFKILESVRDNCSYYLTNYENIENNDDKYREIYKISESLKQYATTLKDWENDKKQKIEEERKRIAAISENEKKQKERFRNYVYYKGWDRIIGKTVSEAKPLAEWWFKRTYKPTPYGQYWIIRTKYFNNSLYVGIRENDLNVIINKNDVIIGYSGLIGLLRDNEQAKNEADNLVKQLNIFFGFESVITQQNGETKYIWERYQKKISIILSYDMFKSDLDYIEIYSVDESFN